MHWAKQYPHSYERQDRQASSVFYGDYEQHEDPDEEVQITLLAGENDIDSKMHCLLGETIGAALLDSGCSKTVCGEQWLECFMDTLDANDKKSISYESSQSVYRFGDGRKQIAENASLYHVFLQVRWCIFVRMLLPAIFLCF